MGFTPVPASGRGQATARDIHLAPDLLGAVDARITAAPDIFFSPDNGPTKGLTDASKKIYIR